KHLPKQRQNLLFSATFSKDIRQLAAGLLEQPEEIDVAPRNATADKIEQRVVFVDKARKRAMLSYLIGSNNWRQVLVFARTKHGANRLCKQLDQDGLPAAALHGNKSQGARARALAAFKAGKVRILVATDIAARGIDIDTLPHVINFDLPHVAADYVHRIGRTGRAGHTGQALSLVGPDERKLLKGIEKLIGRQIERMTVDGIDLHTSTPDKPQQPSTPPRRRQPNKKPQAQNQRPQNSRKRRRKNRSRNQRQQSAATGTT